METTFFLIGGLIVLTIGAELLIRSASKLARGFGISPLVIGLTVVAFGTSAPELAVSIKSSLAGQSDIALGNVVGSNIFNVLFILGICAAILPLHVNKQLVRSDVPIMIGTALLALLVSLDGIIGRVDGTMLVLALIIYTVYSLKKSRAEQRELEAEYAAEFGSEPPEAISKPRQLAVLALGLFMLVTGAKFFVDGAIEVARLVGISELVIGLTIVAIGTSLPEVATSIMATLKGERDIAIGNVVGSNIFNVLSVLGVSAVISPIRVSPAALSFDVPVMIGVSLACLPVFFTGFTISRKEGLLFLFYYIAYTGYLILDSSGHSALPVYSEIMLLYFIPLTAIGLLLLGAKEWLSNNKGPNPGS